LKALLFTVSRVGIVTPAERVYAFGRHSHRQTKGPAGYKRSI